MTSLSAADLVGRHVALTEDYDGNPLSAPEVTIEHSGLFGTWVAAVRDGRTIDVCDSEAAAQEAAALYLTRWSQSHTGRVGHSCDEQGDSRHPGHVWVDWDLPGNPGGVVLPHRLTVVNPAEPV